jgi:hypothetical protein
MKKLIFIKKQRLQNWEQTTRAIQMKSMTCINSFLKEKQAVKERQALEV